MFFYVILDVFKFPKWFPEKPSHTTIWEVYWLTAAFVLIILFLSIYLLRRWVEKQDADQQSSSPEDSSGAMTRMLLTNYPLFLALGMILILYSFFFTTMFGNPGIDKGGGLRDGVYEYVAHWMKIHDKPRIPGPPWYYLPRLLLYETLGLFTWFLALGIYSFRAIQERIQNVERPSLYWPWRFFLVFYSLFSILVYSKLQEKVPWLLVHQALPLILLAGTFFGDIWEQSRFKVIQVIAGTFFVVLALCSLKSNILLNCYNNDNPKEIMVYTQSDNTVMKIMKEIEDICYKTTEGVNTRISIKGTAQWPFSWYLRNYKNWSISVDKRAPIIIHRQIRRTKYANPVGRKVHRKNLSLSFSLDRGFREFGQGSVPSIK